MRFITHAVTLLMVAAVPTALATAPAAAQPAGKESTEVAALVERFHALLTAGDSSAVLAMMADDAILLEAGGVETRSEYGKDHLPADIEFEKGVSTKRSAIRVAVRGDTAWATSTSEVAGTFRGRAVDFLGAESMVLSRESEGWRIRAIHWSSRPRRPSP